MSFSMARAAVAGFLGVAAMSGCGMQPLDLTEAPPAVAAAATPAPTCRMSGNLSGALEREMQWERPHCSAAVAQADPTALELQWAEPKVLLFQVTMPNPAAALGAASLPATVVVRQQSGRRWRTLAGACTVEVSDFGLARQTALGDLYYLNGRGHCTSPALPDPADTNSDGAPLSIGDFVFSTAPLL